MANDPKVSGVSNATTPGQAPLVDGDAFSTTTFRFPLTPPPEGIRAEAAEILTKLQDAPRDPIQKEATLKALDDLGKLAQSFSGDRAEFKDSTADLRRLCGSTNDVDVKQAVFVALERIGLVEPETLRMLRHESHSDYTMIGAAARHAFYAVASQRVDSAASAA